MRSVRKLVTLVTSSFITLMLALGFIASCILLAVHVARAEHVDLAIVGEFLLVAVLALEGIVAISHLRQSRLDSLHVLFEVLEQFRSAEMMLALVSLWRFRSEHGANFVQVYLDTWRQDEKRIAQLPAEEQEHALRATLHFRRRVVKEFYNTLAGLYDLRVVPGEIIYTYWSAAELAVIPEILIPLETAVARELRIETKLGDWFDRLRRLHDDRPVWEQTQGRS